MSKKHTRRSLLKRSAITGIGLAGIAQTGSAREPGRETKVRIRRHSDNPISKEELVRKRHTAMRKYRNQVNLQKQDSVSLATPDSSNGSIIAYNFDIDENGTPTEYYGYYDDNSDQISLYDSSGTREGVDAIHEEADIAASSDSYTTDAATAGSCEDGNRWCEWNTQYKNRGKKLLKPHGTIEFRWWKKEDPTNSSYVGVPTLLNVQAGKNIPYWDGPNWKIVEGWVKNSWFSHTIEDVYPNQAAVGGRSNEKVTKGMSVSIPGGLGFDWQYTQKASRVEDRSNTHFYANQRHKMDITYRSSNSQTRALMTPASTAKKLTSGQDSASLRMSAKWAKGLDDWNPVNDGNWKYGDLTWSLISGAYLPT